MDSKHIINGLGLYFYRVAENSQDVFWIRSPDFTSVLYVNPAFEALWGRSADTIYGSPEEWLDPVSQADRASLIQSWKEFSKAPQINDSHNTSYRIVDTQNNVFTVTDSCYPLFHEGRCVAFVGVVTKNEKAPAKPTTRPNLDATVAASHQRHTPTYSNEGGYLHNQDATTPSLNSYEVPLSKAYSTWSGSTSWQGADHQSQNHFLDMMNHELRTPLNAVLGMAQILQQSSLTPEQHDQLDVIIQSGKNLLTSLSSILDFAQLESNRIKLNPRSIAIRAILQDSLEKAKNVAENPNVHFIMRDDPLIPDKLIGDEKRIKQVIDHLLENAASHTQKGQITLNLSLAERKNAECIINIEVSDTGAGIPAHKLHHIFNRFSQSGSGYQRHHHGIGLGLAVVKELITKMGGTITVTSTVGKGSHFTCSIPLEIDISELSSFDDSAEKEPDPLALNVLVVEDNPINQKITQRLLEQAGCQVNIAECGRAAVSSANDHHDLILMDIGLPDIDGFEATTRIREDQRVSDDVPIIAMTAHVFDQDKERCFQVGMNEVIAKPILREELLDLLHRWSPLNRKNTIQAPEKAQL